MSKMIIANKFSFTALRERAGLTLQQVSEITGVTLRTVYRWENGQCKPKDKVIRKLRRIGESRMASANNNEKLFTFIDLFAGIGGMRMGFEAAGGECVFTCEWNKYSLETYFANFPNEHPVALDITKTDISDIPEHDVLLAGFPCQPFSIAGVSKKNALGRPHGFECKTQGTLFFDIAKIIEKRRPAAFLLENVKNLKSHDGGTTFQVICETLDELDYYYDCCILDAKGWLPQHRERIFIAGFREDCGFSFGNLRIPDPADGPTLANILHPENGTEAPEPPYTEGTMGAVNPKYTLSDKLWQYLQDYAAKHRAKGNGFGFGLVGPEDTARTLSARYYKDGSEILVRQEGMNPRRLTPRECSRLMGFDRPGSSFRIPVSDTQAYRQFGNSVAVPVVETVANYMQPYILDVRRVNTIQLPLKFTASAEKQVA